MRVNYKTHQPLEWLKNGRIPDIINIDRVDTGFFIKNKYALDIAEKAMIAYRDGFLKEAFVVREPFYDAVLASEERLWGVTENCISQGVLPIITATYLYRDLVIFFHFNSQFDGKNQEAVLMTFHKDGSPMMLFVADKSVFSGGALQYVSKHWNDEKGQEAAASIRKMLLAQIRILVGFEIFKKFADVETVYVAANSKKKHDKEKTLNETAIPLIFLDSKWFRNIVRTEGFSVRGHFRLQPKKVNGEWTKELIWINEFEKSGYVSKAKMLNQ